MKAHFICLLHSSVKIKNIIYLQVLVMEEEKPSHWHSRQIAVILYTIVLEVFMIYKHASINKAHLLELEIW